MKAAFIVMSILGCDDAGANCAAIAQVPEQWQTIAACDAASEKQLARFTNVNYPMVVAVCQTAGTTALSDSTDDSEHFDMASRSVAKLPSAKGLKDTVTYPVHVVNDTYSWVARRISD
jgi:hypothetical protein